ncbi:MAG: hypothetical protein LBT55_06935 [Clostridiaceae bacterium]|jgi:beta-mannosidase|nr:hypothetical protein [Clostridiaceae bacterium]
MQKINLNGKWRFKETEAKEWTDAEVPGTQYTDLMRAGKLSDPFDACNEKDCFWPAEKGWIYERVFMLDADTLAREFLELNLLQVDTLATVFLNGVQIGKCENAHLKYVFNIKETAVLGENLLRVEFVSTIPYIAELQKTDPVTVNMNGITGIPHIRKPQCHYGWDWGPRLPVTGLTRDVFIEAYDAAKIEDFEIKQVHKAGAVTLSIRVALSQHVDGEVLFAIAAKSGTELKATCVVDDGAASAVIRIEKPELWQTRELSRLEVQPLYTVTAALATMDGKTVYTDSKRIGLRTVTLERGKDEFGEQFRFRLNGVPLFIKGANWIPPDSFVTRFTAEKLDYFINSALEANMNMLRVWGGGYYESDEFYDKCDEKGILVWQDFAFACAAYPFYNDEFLANVLAEVDFNVKRLRSHACLAVWSGNNEIEAMSGAWFWKRKLMSWTKKFFWEILPEQLKNSDTATPYIPGSPTGTAFMKKVASDNAGDTHLWHVWHGLQPLTYYRKRYTRFCSEFGLESLPDKQTLYEFAKPEDYSFESDTMRAHQKCMSGNAKIIYYISTRFRLPQKFTDYVYLSQITQSECVRDATEHWRRNRGRCNGSMYWQFNDCWPVSSWAGMDYYGRFKALQYSAKRFNAPVLLSVYADKNVVTAYTVNDLNMPFNGSAEYVLQDFNGAVLTNGKIKVSVNACASERLFSLDFSKEIAKTKGNCVLTAVLHDCSGEVISEASQLFKPEKKLKLLNPRITAEFKQEDAGCVRITLAADKYARYVCADLKGAAFSDNFFDLAAGEAKTVYLNIPDGMTYADVKKNFSVSSLYDVQPAASILSDNFKRLKIALQPMNIISKIVYKFM